MAVLNEANRVGVWAGFQRGESRIRRTLGLTKDEVRAAVDATDDWIDDNAASFNAALPQPARSALNAEQKLKLFLTVAQRRCEPS